MSSTATPTDLEHHGQSFSLQNRSIQQLPNLSHHNSLRHKNVPRFALRRRAQLHHHRPSRIASSSNSRRSGVTAPHHAHTTASLFNHLPCSTGSGELVSVKTTSAPAHHLLCRHYLPANLLRKSPGIRLRPAPNLCPPQTAVPSLALSRLRPRLYPAPQDP